MSDTQYLLEFVNNVFDSVLNALLQLCFGTFKI